MTSVCPDNIDVGPVEAPSVFRAVVTVSTSRQIISANVFVVGVTTKQVNERKRKQGSPEPPSNQAHRTPPKVYAETQKHSRSVCG